MRTRTGDLWSLGTVIRYGDVATIFDGMTEEFKAGAFGDVEGADLIVNRMHQRSQPLARTGAGLRIIDSSEEMRAEVTLPDTSIGRDTAVEVTNRLLRGLSLEFRAIKDTFDDSTGHRTIHRAQMFGFGVVDRPAYPGSVATIKRWADYLEALGIREVETPTPPDPDPEEEGEDESEEEAAPSPITVYRFTVV